MKVVIDQDKCVGAGQCVLLAPDVFDQRDEDMPRWCHCPGCLRCRALEADRSRFRDSYGTNPAARGRVRLYVEVGA